MGMISRYQRPGGFLQLLQLIETCGKQKQDNFLNIVESEDPKWARAVREKMLTIDKIFAWDDNTLAEISGQLPILTLATAMHGLSTEQKTRLLKTFTHAQKRTIDDLYLANSPTPTEVTAAFFKILERARAMMFDGRLRVEKFASELVIPENFEQQLNESSGAASTKATEPAPVSILSAPSQPSVSAAELLQKKIRDLLQENDRLKAEVRELREKLKRQSAA